MGGSKNIIISGGSSWGGGGGNYVEKKNKEFDQSISSGGYVELKKCKVHGSVTSGGYTELTSTVVDEMVRSGGYMEFRGGEAKGLQSGGYMEVKNSTIGDTVIAGGYLEGKNLTAKKVDAGGRVQLKDCSISESIKGGDQVEAKDCPLLGRVTGGSITLTRCDETSSVDGDSVELDHSKVVGDVFAKNSFTGDEAVIAGTLKLTGRLTSIKNSTIGDIEVSAPPKGSKPVSVDAKGGATVEVGADGIDWVQWFRDGTARLEKTEAKQVKMKMFGSTMYATQPGGYELSFPGISGGRGNRSQMNNLTILGASSMSMHNNRVVVKIGRQQIEIPGKDQLLAALEASKQVEKVDENAEEKEMANQLIILDGGSVGNVRFEEEGGVIRLLNGAQVKGEVTNGRIIEEEA